MNPENPDLNSEVAALRNQVYVLLVALIVVSGTLTVYLYRQASMARKDIEAIQPQAEQIINAFNQNQGVMVNFVNQLVAYGQTHPDFCPVLAKYGIAPGSPAARRWRGAAAQKIEKFTPASRRSSDKSSPAADFFCPQPAHIGSRRLVAPVDHQIADVGNPSERVGKNEDRILLVQRIAQQRRPSR